MTFRHEKQAMNNEPLPDKLSLEEQSLYLSLRSLYISYRLGGISREQGHAEKNKLLAEFEKRKKLADFAQRRNKHTVAMWKAIERIKAAYRKNKSIENADKLVDAIEGKIHRWKEIGVERNG